jgi:deoxycytidylate deaminase
MNCIISAARLGVSVKGATLYLNTVLPCMECTKAIINAGIVEVVAEADGVYDGTSRFLRENSSVIWRTYSPT